MAEDTPKKLSWRKKKTAEVEDGTKAKIMIEPEEKVMEEVPSMLPPEAFDVEEEEVFESSPSPKTPSVGVSKTMLDSHPVAKKKYHSILSQRATGARKYLRSK